LEAADLWKVVAREAKVLHDPRADAMFLDSWLNQGELWFAKTERDLLARGIFTSIPGPRSEDSAIYHSVQPRSETDPLDLQQSGASNYY
jgi:hypothetical protein